MPGANPMRGEHPIGGHKLVVTFNSVCALEEVTGRKVLDLMADMQYGLGFVDLRLWVQTLLDEQMSLEQVGELLGEVGFEPALQAIAKAFESFFPAAKKGKDKNPPKAE